MSCDRQARKTGQAAAPNGAPGLASRAMYVLGTVGAAALSLSGLSILQDLAYDRRRGQGQTALAALGVTAAGTALGLGLAVRAARRLRSASAVQQYNQAAAEINRLLAAAGDPPSDQPFTKYHLFDAAGAYQGWTHSRPAAEKMAALNGFHLFEASSEQPEEETIRAFKQQPQEQAEK